MKASPSNASDQLQQTIAGIKALYKKYNAGLDFTFAFPDDDYNALYTLEQRVSAFMVGSQSMVAKLCLSGKVKRRNIYHYGSSYNSNYISYD